MGNYTLENQVVERKNVEEALHQMEAKYRSMFENAVSGIFQTTPDGHYLDANPALARLYGYDSTREMMANLTDIQHQLYVDPKRRQEFIAALQEHDAVSEFESKIYRRDGSIIWISENARAVRNSQGELLYYEGFVEDITQRKHAEAALKESEERLRLVIEGVKDYAIFMLDTRGYVSSWNTGAASILGYHSQEIIGQHYSCFYTSENIKIRQANQELDIAVRTGRFEEENWRVRKNGSQFWGNIITTPLYDEQGQLCGFCKVVRDITERKQAANTQARLIASLQESEKKFRNLYEFTTDAVILVDEHNNFLDCNRAALNLFACQQKSDLINLAPWVLKTHHATSEEVLKTAQEQIKKALKTGSARFDWRHRRCDGLEFPAEVLLTSMDLGERVGLQIVIRDITTRIQVQEALKQANEALEDRVQERTCQLETAIKQLQAEIAERQRAETQLRLSEEKFSKAFRCSPDPLVICTLDTGKFIEVNESFLSLMKYSVEEVIGYTETDLKIWLNPENPRHLRHLLETQEIVRNQEYQLRVKSGEIVVCLLSAEIINLGGEPCLLSVMTDITERKRAEEALEESQRMLATLMGNLPGMAYRFTVCQYQTTGNLANSLEFVSQGCYQLTGYTAEEFTQTHQISLTQLTHAEDKELLWEAIQTALKANRPYQLIYRITTKNGEIKWVWEQGIGVFSPSGDLLALEGLITDITQQKQAQDKLRESEQQLQIQKAQLEATLQELQQTQATLIHTEKMSSLGEMVAGVAHEINNPVTCVCGNLVHLSHYTTDLINLLDLYAEYYPAPRPEITNFIEEIELDFLREDLPKVITAMEMGADRIRDIVRSLRNFSRTDDSQRSNIDIHEGIEGTLLILKNRLKAQGSKPAILVHKKYSQLPLIPCYVGQLNQVFMNLIGNAIDALEEYNEGRTDEEIMADPACITIQTELKSAMALEVDEAPAPSDIAIIRIADNGPGIPQEVQDYLFEPFFTTKPAGKGTGLGLSISYQIIVEKHGGQLRCVSGAGAGSEFIIEIPIQYQ